MQKYGLAISPDLQQRLEQQFPPGTSEDALAHALHEQGFSAVGAPCKNEPSIHASGFQQYAEGVLSHPMTASVFWKVDEAGKIQWIKGSVAFTGL